MRRAICFLFLVILSVANAGCYKYVEARPEALAPGSDVQVRVTRARALELEEGLQQEDTQQFVGVVLDDTSPEHLRLSVPFQGVQAGSARRGFNSIVDLPVYDVELIQKRTFDWVRTGGLVGLSAVVTVAVLEAFFDPSDDTEGDMEPGDTEAAIIPLFSIRW